METTLELYQNFKNELVTNYSDLMEEIKNIHDDSSSEDIHRMALIAEMMDYASYLNGCIRSAEYKIKRLKEEQGKA